MVSLVSVCYFKISSDCHCQYDQCIHRERRGLAVASPTSKYYDVAHVSAHSRPSPSFFFTWVGGRRRGDEASERVLKPSIVVEEGYLVLLKE